MKLTAFILLIACTTVNARNGYGQKISLSENKAPLKRVFHKIEKQTNYQFLFFDADLKKAHHVSLHVKNAALQDVLQQLFQNQPLTYIIKDKIIVVRHRPLAPSALTDRLPDILISGQVKDSATGKPLVGVTIKVKPASPSARGKNIGTVTDVEGKFSLDVPDDAVLEVSYLGYKPKEISVDGKTDFNISLAPATTGLNQLVVVGYGTQKKENLTGSISTVDMVSKAGQPIANVSNALYGTPGLYVNLINSMPGTDRAQIRVRGIGNLTATGSDPLVLVDGLEYPMDEINPDDIASISILKDASAAIYGSRAANGVILVTTKKGKGEAKVNYNYYYGIQQPTFMPDAVWDPIEYMKLFRQAELNEGKQTTSISEAQIHEYEVGMHIDPYTYPAIDWFDRVMRNGYIQKHNISASQSTDKYSYRASIGYMDREGIFIGPGNAAKRYTIGLNTSLNVGNRLKIGVGFNGTYRTYTEPGKSTSTFLNALNRSLPIMPDKLRDGRYGYTWLRIPGRNNWENPLMYLEEGNYEKRLQWIQGKLDVNYKLPFGITYEAKLGISKYDAFLDRFITPMRKYEAKTGVELVTNNGAPQSYNYDDNNMDIHFYNTLNWSKNFSGVHDLSAMFGASYDNYAHTKFNAQMRGYFDNTLTALDAGTDRYAIAGRSTRDILESYFGRINYDYENKYLLEAIFRFDGSSRFAPRHRWGFFPGVSAGWRVDKEPFFEGVDFIDMLKIRASVGQLGNQAVTLYSYENDVTLGHNYSFGGTNGTLFQGAASTALADPTTSWETTTDYDLGVDLELWRNRLSLTVDIYQKWTTGLLRTVDIPDQVGGLSGPKKNVGTISNKGYEVGLRYRNHIGNFNYSIYGNVSFNRNRVEDLEGEVIYNNSNSGISTITKEGSVVSAYYLLQAEGIFQSDEEVSKHAFQSGNTKAGYIKYKDINGDGKINDDDRVRLNISTVTPKYNYGFGFNIGYKGISLSANFQGVGGYYVLPRYNLAFPFYNGAGVTWKWATDSWTPQRPHAKLPILTEANYGGRENFKQSTFWLKNASYLRLKNIQLDYKIPTRWLAKIKIKALSVFINAENWLTFTHFKEADPEGIFNASTLYHYPMLKTINAGLNVTF